MNVNQSYLRWRRGDEPEDGEGRKSGRRPGQNEKEKGLRFGSFQVRLLGCLYLFFLLNQYLEIPLLSWEGVRTRTGARESICTGPGTLKSKCFLNQKEVTVLTSCRGVRVEVIWFRFSCFIHSIAFHQRSALCPGNLGILLEMPNRHSRRLSEVQEERSC